jgi:hypothetical protein
VPAVNQGEGAGGPPIPVHPSTRPASHPVTRALKQCPCGADPSPRLAGREERRPADRRSHNRTAQLSPPLPKARRPRGGRPGPAASEWLRPPPLRNNRRTCVEESRKATPTQCVSHLSVSCNNRYNFRRSFEVLEPWSKPCLTYYYSKEATADPKKSRSARQTINQARVCQVNLDLLLFSRGMRLELDRSRHRNFGALW